MLREDNRGKNYLIRLVRVIEPEAILWLAALSLLLFVDPYGEQHFSFCIFKNLGFESCPGCGLGRSIALIYRGELAASFGAHPLGIITFGFICARIIRLFRRTYHNFRIYSGGQYGRYISTVARDSGR